MKTVPPPCPEPDLGPRYWRSLDELAHAPDFRQRLLREFPAGASELTDGVARRDFMKLMSASTLLAGLGLTGCRRPEEEIYPFSKMPDDYVHGVPQYYATALPTRTGAVPLIVKEQDGRPVKVEGNAQHPDGNGGTDVFAQASILGLYDPDRARRFLRAGNEVTRAATLDFLDQLGRDLAGRGGAKLAILAGSGTSPSRARLRDALLAKLPQAAWFTYDAVDFGSHQRGATAATGKPVVPYYRLEAAQVIVSLDADLLGTEEDSARFTRGFARNRKLTSPHDHMARLYAVEALMTLTGANADHRLRIPASQVFAVAAALAAEVIKSGPVADAVGTAARPEGVVDGWVRECARDLLAHKGRAVVVAGHRQPLAVHCLAHALNAALGSVGTAVEFHEAPAGPAGGIAELARRLGAGEVDTLVILDGNPVYDAPADLDWAATQRRATNIVRLGAYEDETAAVSDWHLAAAHYLESWGDARTSDGTLVPVQPLIEPLYDGMTALEVLARLAGETVVSPHDIARTTFAQVSGKEAADDWKRFLHDGFLAGSAARPVEPALDAAAVAQAVTGHRASRPTREAMDVVFVRDSKLDDGRYANNAWLQELPDPITKLTWDNPVLMSRRTATGLGLVNTELVEIELAGRKVTGPVWVMPGMADDTVGLPLGYGREKAGRVANFRGTRVGFDAYRLRTVGAPDIAAGARVTGTGRPHVLASTQDHWAMEGRPIVREANLDQYVKKPDFARWYGLASPNHTEYVPKDAQGNPLPIYQSAYQEEPKRLKSEINQWGLSIDLNSCTGCSACVIACQSENNIPIVGKEQVLRNREMHWLRIDRYFTGMRPADLKRRGLPGGGAFKPDQDQWEEDWIDDPQVVNQPMMCQHCEAAPCESVCPVNATVHDAEGLNVMAYNRCVGTRYCSNNCAWKVRRFNFFDFNKRPINYGDTSQGEAGELYKGPFAKRDPAALELVRMASNPEVTVRMRGVMEKCTFCTQRIESAKIAQKIKAGASGNVEVPDGVIKTACQQACPAEAIVFGNLLDPRSRVTALKKQERDYAVLGFLNNRPRLTYLAKVRNPNPEMPDYKEHPLPFSAEEYEVLNHDNPFAVAPEAGSHGEPQTVPAGAEKGGHP